MRKSIAESWDALEDAGADAARNDDGTPSVGTRMPNYDDDMLSGVSFFRGGWSDIDLAELTFPRTYFARSQLERVRFSGSDLSESRMCWNDFVECDFTGSDLSGCDLRASVFRLCVFREANLRGCDLRLATFDACIFEGATLTDVTADVRVAGSGLRKCMTGDQLGTIRFANDPGQEPPGG